MRTRTFPLVVLVLLFFAALPAEGQFYQPSRSSDEPAKTEGEVDSESLARLEAGIAELRGDISELHEAIGALESNAGPKTSYAHGGTWPTILAVLRDYDRQIAALRAEVAALAGGSAGEAKSMTPEQAAQKAALSRELEETENQIAAMQKAIKDGLDPALVEGTMESLESQSEALNASLHELDFAAGSGGALESHSGVTTPEENGGAFGTAREPIGLAVEFNMASAYLFRGWNVFMEKSQKDQHALFSPGLTYSLDNGLWFSYLGAFQWNGDNQAEMVDVGLGHEQDLIAGYDWEWVPDQVSASTFLTYYFYPFANEEAAGASNPSYLEPGFSLAYSGRAELGLQMLYFKELQSDLGDLGYFYINPSISKEFQFSRTVGFSFGLGYGYKIFSDSEMKSYKHDLAFDWEVPLTLEGGLGITPGIHFGWTNLDDASRGEEYVVWTSLSTGFDL